MTLQVWLIDAFTDCPFGGNPAGVVPEAAGLSPETMQSIANELHASETAFVFPATDSKTADFRLRFFTPTNEVDLCGHATIASVCGLLKHGVLGKNGGGACRIETAVGVLNVSYGYRDGLEWAEMGQVNPQFRADPLDFDTISRLLGIRTEDLDLRHPAGLSFTGLWDLFVPVKSLEVMGRLLPDLAALAAWNRALGVASTHVYTDATESAAHDFHARDFSPAVGIAEDPATGTATGALMALLYRAGRVKTNRVYRFEQGYEIGRPSLITASVDLSEGILSVRVGGNAYCMLEGFLNL